MSISGFKVNNTIEKYNYSDLDNISVQTEDIANDAVTPDKMSGFNHAGITNVSYETVVNTATVTTTQHDKTYPWGKVLDSTISIIRPIYIYRVTFDDTEYIIKGQFWWHRGNRNTKNVFFVGNASLWGDVDGFSKEIYDVPFLITGGMVENGEYVENEAIYLFTPVSGTHTVKIEKCVYSFTKLPEMLIDGTTDGIISSVAGRTKYLYPSYSIGKNALLGPNGSIALGYYNAVGDNAISVGNSCLSTGQYSFSANMANTASGEASFAVGNLTEASGSVSSAFGARTVANHACQFVFGKFNVLDDSESASNDDGTYVEIVGNGSSGNNRSNARTLDWSGNESLAGTLTLGMGTEDEVTISAAQLKEIIETVLGR